MNLYAIKDLVTNTFSEIYTDINDGSFLRKIQNTLRDKNTSIYVNAKDLEIWNLGNFNKETGTIISTPKVITIINELLEKPDK